MLTTALNFNGTGMQALEFYSNIFGYTLTDDDVVMYSELSKSKYQEEQKDWIAHAEITVYGQRLFISDSDEAHDFRGFSLSINLTDQAELEKVYHALSEEGHVVFPLQKVKWSEAYGVLKDKLGITWQFNLD